MVVIVLLSRSLYQRIQQRGERDPSGNPRDQPWLGPRGAEGRSQAGRSHTSSSIAALTQTSAWALPPQRSRLRSRLQQRLATTTTCRATCSAARPTTRPRPGCTAQSSPRSAGCGAVRMHLRPNGPRSRISLPCTQVMAGDPVEINPSVGSGYMCMTIEEWASRWKRNDDFPECLSCGGTRTKEHFFTQTWCRCGSGTQFTSMQACPTCCPAISSPSPLARASRPPRPFHPVPGAASCGRARRCASTATASASGATETPTSRLPSSGRGSAGSSSPRQAECAASSRPRQL